MTQTANHVYAIGIAGVGVSAIAKFYLMHGAQVSGSDPKESPLIWDLRQLGADIVTVPNPARLAGVDLVVFSDDVPAAHPERVAAKQRGIRSISFAQALGEIMAAFPTRVAVAGTNGKSTTSAFLGIILAQAGLNPSVFVGSRVPEFKGNLLLGQRKIFVSEADEYRDHFFHLHPTMAVVTNIELDHVEFFHDIKQVETSFRTLVDSLPSDGLLIYNADDDRCVRLWSDRPGGQSVGFSNRAHLKITDYVPHHECERFALATPERKLGQFELHVPGRFNAMNAAMAIAAALNLGADIESVRTSVAQFRGIWRRFEILNPQSRVKIVNDYAHHPTGVRVTLQGARDFYPGHRIIAVFQPHHFQRLTALFSDFINAFSAADQVVLTDVFAVAGREHESSATRTSQDLARALHGRGVTVTHAPNLIDVVNALAGIVRDGDIVILMGAGDIWTIGDTLAQAYGQAK